MPVCQLTARSNGAYNCSQGWSASASSITLYSRCTHSYFCLTTRASVSQPFLRISHTARTTGAGRFSLFAPCHRTSDRKRRSQHSPEAEAARPSSATESAGHANATRDVRRPAKEEIYALTLTIPSRLTSPQSTCGLRSHQSERRSRPIQRRKSQ